ncbi:carbon starvation induced protein CsiD [Burkholderia anthina]|uniref:carbon starvation induced protein CsiD n=1 Tax=Burkholderia anthina TaxID=179879 RepID=UPI0037BEB1F2
MNPHTESASITSDRVRASVAPHRVVPHPESQRLPRVALQNDDVRLFLDDTAHITTRSLEYVPYSRFTLTESVQRIWGTSLIDTLRALIVARRSGGFVLDIAEATTNDEDLIRFTTALAHAIGTPDNDVLSGKFYARLPVQSKDVTPQSSNLFQPYRTFGLHTDGAASPSPTTDWLVFGKTVERHVKGGRNRLLHLDDWRDLRRFANAPQGRKPFLIALPPSSDPRQQQWGNNVRSQPLDRPIFFDWHDELCVRFADQFIHPTTLEDAAYLREFVESIESDPAVEYLTIPVGSMMFLNNNYWLHGREVFEPHPELFREIIRMRGMLRAA